MESAVKLVKILRAGMLVSIALYGLVGELVAKPANQPRNIAVFNALTLLAVVMVAVIVVVRRSLVLRAEEALSSAPGDAAALNRWRGGYIVTYAICEAIALFGLVLRILGFTIAQVAPFYVAGIVLMLFFNPRLPSRELS